MGLGFLLAVALGAVSLFADQITLSNGDRITASIIKKDGEKLTIKSEILGEITLPWASVAGIQSEEPLYVVVPGQEPIAGRVTTQNGNLRVDRAGTPVVSPLAGISAIRGEEAQRKYERLLHPGYLDLWAGYFDLGFALTRGNARTQTLNTAFNMARATRTDKTTLRFNQIYSRAEINRVNDVTARAVRGGIAYDHNLGSRAFYNLLNDYEYDQFQDLDLRFVLGGGFGYHAIKTEQTRLDLVGGTDYMRESFGSGIARNSVELYFGDDFAYAASGVTSITQSFRIFPNLTRTGDYRMNFDIGLATALRRWLSWQVTASDRFLTNPVFGRQRNDVLFTTGFRVNFAR